MGIAFFVCEILVIFALLGGLAWIAFFTDPELLAAVLNGSSPKTIEDEKETDGRNHSTQASSTKQSATDQLAPVQVHQTAMSTHGSENKYERREEQQRSAEPKQPASGVKWTDIAQVVILSVYVIATIALAAFALGTLNAAKEANIVAARTAEAAKASADAARQSVALSMSSQKTSDETLQATKSIAQATQKTAEANQKVAEATQKALEFAAQANITSEKALGLNNDTAKKQLRAYVAVENASITYDEKTHIFHGNVIVINSGQTPAHNVAGTACLHFEPRQFKGDLGLCAFDRQSGFTMASRVEQTFPCDGSLRPNEIPLYYGNQITAWLAGEVRYRDIYDQEHVTKFRFVQTGPLSSQIQIAFDLAGNESD